MQIVLWPMALLSATLFNLAFFFPDILGFLILFFWIPLFFVLNKPAFLDTLSCHRYDLQSKSLGMSGNGLSGRAGCVIGLILGFMIFTSNLSWLLILLLTKSNASILQAIILYLFIVLYASIITTVFISAASIAMNLFKNLFAKFSMFFLALFSFFYFLINYSLIIFGRAEGYPFINPFIPLVKYKSFIFIIRFLTSFFYPRKLETDNFLGNPDFKVFYLKTIEVETEKQGGSPHYYSQIIYQRLCEMDLFKYQKKYKNLVVVAPESTFPFPINKNLDQVEFWSNVLPENAILMLGTMRSEKEKTYQTMLFIKNCLIINRYDKSHLILFTEKLNYLLGNFSWAKKLFLNGKKQFDYAEKTKINKSFSLNSKWCIIPQICSEFFWRFNAKEIESLQEKLTDKSSIIFLFSNDSWFVSYFRKNIENLVYLKSMYYNLPVLYIAHKNYFLTKVFS